ncbi:MAG: bifunctional ornithine acetyltransferase/N-acetylglutamate synthase [Niameybacter sp.]|nr:bifunctional ornithine acetyltransferase/N-acetylglutamate synthase [Niameybacter sp.]
MKLINQGILAAKGFVAVGEHIGIKKQKKDMAMLYSKAPCMYAGAFTQNKVKAAPVIWDQKVLKAGEKVHAIVINSGNANAVTGIKGHQDTEQMAQCTAEQLGIKKEEVLVCSTGVIGVPLPMECILDGIDRVVSKLEHTPLAAKSAAEAILTTDTFTKEIALEETIGGCKIRLGAIGKGSGMIHPNMATMLAFITTDINISQTMLQKALSECVETSFNMITVDGDTSTNDSVIVLANGVAGNSCIIEENEDYEAFKGMLFEALKYVAISIVKDGEGATKLLEVEIKNTLDFASGKALAKSILTSSLVKTAFFGEDANWGRILAAMGYAGADFNVEGVSLALESAAGSIQLFKQGTPLKFNEIKAKRILEETEIKIVVKMSEGSETVTAWGCDLSYDYVKINGEYRS